MRNIWKNLSDWTKRWLIVILSLVLLPTLWYLSEEPSGVGVFIFGILTFISIVAWGLGAITRESV